MSEDPDISVRNVCKAYRIWDRPSARILSPLKASIGEDERARSYPDFWAISNRRLANLVLRWASGSSRS